MLTRTPSLVDDLLCEIYSRFGNGYGSHRPLDSSQRASASGSQVRISKSKNSKHIENGIFLSVMLCNSISLFLHLKVLLSLSKHSFDFVNSAKDLLCSQLLKVGNTVKKASQMVRG